MLSLRDRLSFALPHVALMRLRGPIGQKVDPARYQRVFGALSRFPMTRAVVLEWDSPGGGVTASEEMKAAVQQLGEARPVVSHIAGVGASGAYMAAIAAHKVVAAPSSVVGSIGVLSLRPVLGELLQKIGVGFEVTKSGPFKDMGAFYREPTPEERVKEEELVAEFFSGFVAWVAKARRMPERKVRQLSTGEVFTGRRAAKLGLVDEIGDRRRAINLAAQLGGISPRVVEVTPRRSVLEQLNPAAMAIEIAGSIGAAFARGLVDELRGANSLDGRLRA
jgi:protease-4